MWKRSSISSSLLWIFLYFGNECTNSSKVITQIQRLRVFKILVLIDMIPQWSEDFIKVFPCLDNLSIDCSSSQRPLSILRWSREKKCFIFSKGYGNMKESFKWLWIKQEKNFKREKKDGRWSKPLKKELWGWGCLLSVWMAGNCELILFWN